MPSTDLSTLDLKGAAKLGFPSPDVLNDAFNSGISAAERRKMLRPMCRKPFEKILKGESLPSLLSLHVPSRVSVRPTPSSFRDYTSDTALIALALGAQPPEAYLSSLSGKDHGSVKSSDQPSGYHFGLHPIGARRLFKAAGMSEETSPNMGSFRKALKEIARAVKSAATGEAAAKTALEAEASASFGDLDLSGAIRAYAKAIEAGVSKEHGKRLITGLPGLSAEIAAAAENLIGLAWEQGNDFDPPETIEGLALKAYEYVTHQSACETKADDSTTGAPVPTGPSYTVPAALRTALDAILNSASLPSIDTLIGEIDEGKSKIRELDERIEKLAISNVSKTPAKVSATGELPSGGAKWVSALDALIEAGITVPPSKKKLFAFEVPCFTWDAPHRDVPNVDPDYRWRWDILAKLMWGLAYNKKPWIWGHTGTGKTTLVEQVAAILRWPFVRINFDSEITRMDLVGRDTLRTDEHGNTVSVFQDGILPQAMSAPTIICNDELDFVRSDIAYVYQRALEDKGLLLTEDGGRLVRPHEYSRMVATANTQGQGDEFGLYQGARVQSQAFLDRFQCWIEVPYLKETDERELIASKVPTLTKEMISRVVNYVTEHREAFKQAAILKPISPRGVVSLSEALAFFTKLQPETADGERDGVRMALETTVLGSVTHADAAKINELVDRTFN